MKKLTCSLFGHPRLKLAGQKVNIKSRKGLGLLAYLAATGWPVERELLAALLWPDYDNSRARANLRRTLFTLQRTPVAAWLKTDQDTIALTNQAVGSIDIVLFNSYLAAGTQDTLKEAVALYHGDFLTGFYLPDSEPFEEWAFIERQRYLRQALQALDRLTTNYLMGGAYSSAELSARRQLELDNFREPAWRQLMAALVGSGRRAEALAEFSHCRRLLQNEFGVEPAGETMALAATIQQIDAPAWSLAQYP